MIDTETRQVPVDVMDGNPGAYRIIKKLMILYAPVSTPAPLQKAFYQPSISAHVICLPLTSSHPAPTFHNRLAYPAGAFCKYNPTPRYRLHLLIIQVEPPAANR